MRVHSSAVAAFAGRPFSLPAEKVFAKARFTLLQDRSGLLDFPYVFQRPDQPCPGCFLIRVIPDILPKMPDGPPGLLFFQIDVSYDLMHIRSEEGFKVRIPRYHAQHSVIFVKGFIPGPVSEIYVFSPVERIKNDYTTPSHGDA